MSGTESGNHGVRVAAHYVPAPRTVSEAARRMLAAHDPAARPLPDHTDVATWQAVIRAVRTISDEATITALACATSGAVVGERATTVDDREVSGVTVYDASPVDLAPQDDRVVISIHGGSFVHGGGKIARRSAELLASSLGLRVWAIDYRMPPEHPFPAGLDDVVSVYQSLAAGHDPGRIGVMGTSAGGNLAAALSYRLRDLGIAAPAGLVLHTPIVDLAMQGDSWAVLAGLDASLENAIQMSHLYTGEENFENPYASPLHGDVSCFPPTLLLSGTRDPVLSDTVRLHRKLLAEGVPADLVLTEAEPHGGWFSRAPEDTDRMRVVTGFLSRAFEDGSIGRAKRTGTRPALLARPPHHEEGLQ